jgi:acyl-CoA synthetase (NDP forming)
MPSISALLRPQSVAIVGDTPGPGRGGWIHDQLVRMGYDRPIYPVNPKYGEVRGLRCYPSLLDIPAPVEFAAVALGAGHALRAMEECIQKQVRAILFIASGFAEAGPAGKAIQDALRRLALAHVRNRQHPRALRSLLRVAGAPAAARPTRAAVPERRADA